MPLLVVYQEPPILARSRKAPHAELPRLAMLLGGTFDYTLRLSDRIHHDSHHQFYRIRRTTHILTGTSDIRTETGLAYCCARGSLVHGGVPGPIAGVRRKWRQVCGL